MALAASALGVLAFAVPAQAKSVSATCTVDGLATTSPGVKVSGGTGTYSFASGSGSSALNVNCVMEDAGNVDVEVLRFTSDGNYLNQICGTTRFTSTSTNGGTIDDPVTRVGGTKDLSDDWWKGIKPHTNQVDLSYAVPLTGGVGQLTFTGAGTIGGGPVSMSLTLGEQTNTGDPTRSQCSVHFQVHGVVNFSTTF